MLLECVQVSREKTELSFGFLFAQVYAIKFENSSLKKRLKNELGPGFISS